MFLELDANSFVNIWSIMKLFEVISGVKINLSESGLVGENADSQILTAFAMLTGCESLQCPLTYLGIPLGGILVLCPFGIGSL